MQDSSILTLKHHLSPFYQGNLATASALSSTTAADNKVIHHEQQTSNPVDTVSLAPQEAAGPFMGTLQAPSQGQSQFPGPWPLVPSLPSMPPPSSIPTPPISSTPVNNLLHQPSLPLNPPNLPLPFGSQPGEGGLNLPPPNQSQFVQNPYMNHPRPPDIRVPPGNPFLPALQPSPSLFPSSAPRPPMTQGPRPMFSHPNIATPGPMPNTSMANTNTPPLSFSSGPSPAPSLAGPLNRLGPTFPPAAPSASLPLPINNGNHGMTIPRGNPFNPAVGPGSSQFPSRPPLPPYESGFGPNRPPIRSSSAATPPNPNFGDFTFQPHHQPQMPRFLPPNAAPPAPPFRSSPVPDFQPHPEPFPRPPIQGRFPFPNMGPSMGDMNSGPPARLQYLGPSAFPSGPGNMIEPRRMFRPPMNQADMFLPPRQQFNHNLPFSRPGLGPREQQIYDPFSPTSAANMPQRHGDSSSSGKRRENDPEYEDLMASVGVK